MSCAVARPMMMMMMMTDLSTEPAGGLQVAGER